MHPRQIDRFFRVFARELAAPATVILTGAAAGSLWGHVRPSLDVDFAIRPARGRRLPSWSRIERAAERTVRLTGIRANYAEDIDRWSAVSLLDYARHTTRYRRFGDLEVRLLDPLYWSIGKVTRYLSPDERDLVAVLQARRVAPSPLVHLWARALRQSPRSPALTQFRRQAEHFLRTHGRTIWGADFDAEHALWQFRLALAGPGNVAPARR